MSVTYGCVLYHILFSSVWGLVIFMMVTIPSVWVPEWLWWGEPLLTHSRHTVWVRSQSTFDIFGHWNFLLPNCPEAGPEEYVYYVYLKSFCWFCLKILNDTQIGYSQVSSSEIYSFNGASQNRIWKLGGKAHKENSVPGIKAIVGHPWERFASVIWVISDTYLISFLVIKVCQIIK